MNIKTNYKEVKNTDKNGILIFTIINKKATAPKIPANAKDLTLEFFIILSFLFHKFVMGTAF